MQMMARSVHSHKKTGKPDNKTVNLDKKTVNLDKKTGNSEFWDNTFRGQQRVARTRRSTVDKMGCVTNTKKVCKMMKYKGKSIQFCKTVTHEKC